MLRLMTAILFLTVLAGCNTLNGMGKDIEKAGEAVQKSSK